MSFFKKNNTYKTKEWKITKKCLNLILESSKSTYPNEFGALLRVDTEDIETIIELVLLPGTISGETHAIFRLNMLPIDFSVVGSVHSHPSYHPIPSKPDLQLFSRFGKIHIITAQPYNETSWKAYDYKGKEKKLIVI